MLFDQTKWSKPEYKLCAEQFSEDFFETSCGTFMQFKQTHKSPSNTVYDEGTSSYVRTDKVEDRTGRFWIRGLQHGAQKKQT